jgi:hypothetical protein
MNFLTVDEGDERTRAAYSQNHDRLSDIKQKWDPDNFFSMNQNVSPSD